MENIDDQMNTYMDTSRPHTCKCNLKIRTCKPFIDIYRTQILMLQQFPVKQIKKNAFMTMQKCSKKV